MFHYNNRKYLLVIIFLSIFIIVFANKMLAASFNIDSLNLQEAALESNRPVAYFKIGLKEAWQKINSTLGLNLSPITIGIIDTGIDSSHPEFANVKKGNTPPDALIDRGALINNKLESHGTNVAGIIGANNISATSPANYVFPQMNGVLSGVKNLDYIIENRRFSKSVIGLKTLFSVAEETVNLSGTNAKIINLSFTTFNPLGSIIFDSIFNFYSNVLFIVSAGNENLPVFLQTPANLGNIPNVITVGGTTLNDQREPDSNFGSQVSISAPSEFVFSPTFFSEPLDIFDYEDFSGTSASAPMVTGVAGLIKAIKPDLSPAQIKQILISNADPIQTDKPIGGRLNALKAVCDPLVLNCPITPPQPSNTWRSVGPMTTERTQHTSTLLNDGRVLITGGLKGSGQTSTFLNSAEVFDPLTNTFSSVGNLNISRAFHAATLLNDGRVLITGGSSDGNNFLNTAEIFNPSTNTFTLISNMNEARFFHTANLLDSGKVLIAGGVNGQPVKSTEIFDPSTNTFSPGSDMIEKRSHHASAKLNDGRVLLVNGLQADSLTPVEIYDPAANSFTSATSSVEQLGLSVNTLPNGKVLIEGSKLFNQPQGLAAEIFDPVNNAFVEIGPMLILGTARDSSVLLNSGEVLFVGENIKAQLFNLQTNTFKLTGDLNIPSSLQHQLTLLQDGRALLTSVQLLGSVITSDAEVFKP